MSDAQIKQEAIQQTLKEYLDKENLSKVEEMVNTNCVVFQVGDKKYRVKRPNLKQKQLVDRELFKLTNELINEGHLFADQWIAKLKETQGIDVQIMYNRISELNKEIEKKYELLAPTVHEKTRDKFIFEIEQLKNERASLYMDINIAKAPSIDSQILNKQVFYYAYLLTEVEDGSEYKKLFKNLDEFEESDDIKLTSNIINVIQNYIF